MRINVIASLLVCLQVPSPSGSTCPNCYTLHALFFTPSITGPCGPWPPNKSSLLCPLWEVLGMRQGRPSQIQSPHEVGKEVRSRKERRENLRWLRETTVHQVLHIDSYDKSGREEVIFIIILMFVVVFVQSLSCIQLFVTPWTVAYQAPLSCTICQSLLKFMYIKLMILSNHLILCTPFSFCLQSFTARVFSNELALCIRWPSIGASASASSCYSQGNWGPREKVTCLR